MCLTGVQYRMIQHCPGPAEIVHTGYAKDLVFLYHSTFTSRTTTILVTRSLRGNYIYRVGHD